MTMFEGSRSSSDEPVYNSGVSTLIYADNMDGYSTVDAMGAAPTGSTNRITPHPSPVTTSEAVDHARNALITPGRGGSGKALRLMMDGTVTDASTFMTLVAQNPDGLATNHFQYYARINIPGLSGTLAIKWFQAWHGSGRFQWNTHDPFPWAGSRSTYWQFYDTSVATTEQGCQPVGPYIETVNDNAWHRFTHSCKSQSSAGARDGFGRMWIDGTKIIDVSLAAVGVTPPGGEKTWCLIDDVDAIGVNNAIDGLRWGEPQTTTSPAWTYDIDDFIWWTS